MLCERCSADIYKYEICRYCKRKICFNCVKSSRRVTKTIRIVICKDDWGKIKNRQDFKSLNKEKV